MLIENLFPIPIGFFNYENGLTKNEHAFLISLEQQQNAGNTRSKDCYVLKNQRLSKIANFIELSAQEYFNKTINPKNNVRLKITQSWVNWTNTGEHHHKHAHQNSLISGCFYVNANKELDKIFFYKDAYFRIKMPPLEWNTYNSESWWYSIGTNDLIFFPSDLVHMVPPVESSETRISLAFNMFPVGNIGDADALNELILEG